MKNLTREWIGYLLMVCGLLVLASPFLTGAIDGRKQKTTVKTFEENIKNPSKKTKNSQKDLKNKSKKDIEETLTSYDDLYFAFLSYNTELYATNQEKLISTQATESFPIDATEYGEKENVIGVLWIPRMEVELGLYLGANKANMAKGAAVLGQTSVPLGEMNENTAIAGHRGWRGTPMFRGIQEMQIGDKIYIQTRWNTLVYEVNKLLIVLPEDQSWCQIQPGKTIVTLMTCHPYTKHTHRYVVFGELSETLPPDALAKLKGEKKKLSKPQRKKQVTKREKDGTESIVEVDNEAIKPDGTEYGAIWSNLMILTEGTIQKITIGLTVIIIALGIHLSIKTGKQKGKKKKRGKKNAKSAGKNQGNH